MKRQTIRTVILLATISIAGIIFIQLFWMNKAFDLKQKEFDDRVNIILRHVAQEILYMNKDSTKVPPIKQVASNYFVVSINDTLHPFLLESLLKSEFESRNLKVDFEYGIYDCFTDSIVYGNLVNYTDNKKASGENEPPPVNWEGDSHYFGVYFPDKSSHLLSQMGIWIFSSLILLFVIIFFAYTMSVILKQKRLSEIKTDFINNMTHEFKTPISTISVSSEMLKKEDINQTPARLKRYANIIHEESIRLKTQVEKVLQMASLDKDELKLNKTDLDIHELIKKSAESMSLIISGKKGRIQCNLQAADPMVNVDEVHLTNLVYNLLDNAIKYSDGPPEIVVSTKEDYLGITISITDHGIGLTKAEQKNIFSKFYRVPTGNVHNVKGFGLGLHYVKMVCNAHKGTISVESEKGKGSVFEVFLPRKKSNRQPLAESRQTAVHNPQSAVGNQSSGE